ncbi:hypothetical protein C7I36_06330 [Zobellella taiwanensis]|uniref:GIY-YIG domain-containing protein n=1 Tax=Zobellella taiwanensis TaxID=347535 RepID=A0A2P7R4C7_9GAMM|nr:hypothetical protein [Zobellella taiwanensis]PSJ45074.1 hypothetical protein C7I36_06330 [Zobellella taiwanensis]
MQEDKKYNQTLRQISNYVYALCEINGTERKPFYIGRGKGDRCLQHLKEDESQEKNAFIQDLIKKQKIAIDILRHGLDEKSAALIESTCIDLLGVGELKNKIRGCESNMGRMTIDEIHNLYSSETVIIQPEHQGLAFLLNDTYKSGMSELALFESTRGIWHNIPRDESIKYGYATYNGIIKEVYEIHGWVKAGTQEYFTRTISRNKENRRWEFIGRKADQHIRNLYIGKVIEKERSFGHPFVRVGFQKAKND